MTEPDFIASIADDPDDEGPWLVFADWLEEQGDPRGEYLRLVCEIDRLGPDEARDSGLLVRLAQLTREFTIAFEGDGDRRFAVDRKRGFVVGVRMTGGEFRQYGEEVFRASPVRSLELSSVDGHVGAIAADPLLGRLRRLMLAYEGKRLSNVSDLLRSPHLVGLEELVLHLCKIGRATFSAIARAPWRLRTLAIHDWRWRPEWLDLIVDRAVLSQLEVLDLSHCEQLGDDDLLRLRRFLRIESLRELNLQRTNLSTTCAEALQIVAGNRGVVMHSPVR